MSNLPLRPHLTSAAARRIDQACDRFEAAWQAGRRPDLAEHLGTADEPQRSALLRQLLLLDWDYRRRAGDDPRTADYHTRFPGDPALIDDVGREMSGSADDTPQSGRREPNLAAETVAGSARYELLQEVGRGGAGVVFRGRDRVLGRELAVKVLREAYLDTPEVRRRFIEEARVGSQLQHPAIVPVYELGWFNDHRPYFTMKLVEGRTFAALLKDRADPGEDRTRLLGIFEQVCQATAYAHGRGVVHRDLKPANVMVGAFGEVQVMDWGFAKILGDEEAPAARSPTEKATDSVPPLPVSGRSGASQSGVVMGTPAYMPPEQAQGKAAHVDPRADVFALGAILCEILTGRPPYAGGAIDEVCRQAAGGDLTDAHARLDACGADEALRELAKRCLTADRAARPTDAGVVARDLAAYLASAQERLRQAQVERAAAEARTHEARAKAKAERRARRLTIALAAAAVLLLASAGGAWWQHDRVQQAQASQAAATDARVEAALAEADDRLKKDDWPGADAAATRARELLDSGASGRWKRRADDLRADLDLMAQIDSFRYVHVTRDRSNDVFSWDQLFGRYAEAFARYGLRVGMDPAEAGARVTQRPAPVRNALVAGLEDWWLVARKRDAAAHDWLGAVLRVADDDECRTQVRRAAEGRDRPLLEDLAAKADGARQPKETVFSLARVLIAAEAYDDAVGLLRPAQRRFPDDFWINEYLGHALVMRRPSDYAEALRFYTAAQALRPDITDRVALSFLLIQKGDYEGVAFVSRQAVEQKPDSAKAYCNLGVGLQRTGQPAQAREAYRKALELDPKLANAHFDLAVSLEADGQLDQSVPEFERAVQLAPDADAAEMYFELGKAQVRRNNPDAALAAFDKTVEHNPRFAAAHNERGNILLDKGQVVEAVAAYEEATRLNPMMDVAYSNLGKALHRQGKLDRAVAAYSRAVELNPRSAPDQYNLGAGLDETGDLAGAIAAYREAIRLDPGLAEAHCNLHFLLQNQGLFAEALTEIKEGHRLGSARPDWRYPSGRWLKQTQRLVDLDAKIPAILDGREKPPGAGEEMEYASVCRMKGLYGASARLYAEAFTAKPAPPNLLEGGSRCQAACVAALAGCGQGHDAFALDAAERARWRKQALDWLRRSGPLGGRVG